MLTHSEVHDLDMDGLIVVMQISMRLEMPEAMLYRLVDAASKCDGLEKYFPRDNMREAVLSIVKHIISQIPTAGEENSDEEDTLHMQKF